MEPIEARDPQLPVCSKCGWYEHGPYRQGECDPQRGKRADALIARLPGIPATKLGYGFGQLAFEPAPGDALFSVQFSVGAGRRPDFDLRDVWLCDDVSTDAAADLVTVLAAWRKRWPGKAP